MFFPFPLGRRSCTQAFSDAGRFQDQLFTDSIDIFIDERWRGMEKIARQVLK